MSKFKKNVIFIVAFISVIACILGVTVGIGLTTLENEANVEVNSNVGSNVTKGNIWDYEDVPDETAVAKIDRTVSDAIDELESMGAYVNTGFNRYENLYIVTINVSGASNEYILYNDIDREEIRENLIASCGFIKLLFENDGYLDTEVGVVLMDSNTKNSTNDGVVCEVLNGIITYDIMENSVPEKLSDI